MPKYRQMIFDADSMEMKPEPDIELDELDLAIIKRLPSFKVGHHRIDFELRLAAGEFEKYCRIVHEKEKIEYICKNAVPIVSISESDARILMKAAEVLKELVRTGQYKIQEKDTKGTEKEDEDFEDFEDEDE